MSSIRSVRSAIACACLATAVSAHAQPAATPAPEAKGQPAPQGFSVVLVLGDGESTTVAENVPAAARKALADMKDFLPYRGYRLLDAGWILGSQRSTSRLRGPEDQEYELTVATTPQGGRIHVRFQLQEPGSLKILASREADAAAVQRAQEQELQARLSRLQSELVAMSKRLGDKHPAVASTGAEIENLKMRLAAFESGEARPRALFGGRSVIDTTFSMDIGETVVVGTSRIRGGDKALIALLTAVPRGAAAATRKD